MSITQLLHLEPLLRSLLTAWSLAGELITVGAILWCLNALARFVRFIAAAVVLFARCLKWGWHFYWQHVVPALLLLADWISWGVAQVDWAEVRSAVKDYSRGSIALAILIYQTVRVKGESYATQLNNTMTDITVSLVATFVTGEGLAVANTTLANPWRTHMAQIRKYS